MSGNIGGTALGDADIHAQCHAEIEKLRDALRDARACMANNDIIKDGVRLSDRIAVLLAAPVRREHPEP
jgi:hypothetical protein